MLSLCVSLSKHARLGVGSVRSGMRRSRDRMPASTAAAAAVFSVIGSGQAREREREKKRERENMKKDERSEREIERKKH